MKPTPLERLFRFILEYKCAHDGNSPTMRDIVQAGHASSTSVASYRLNVLAEQGRIVLAGSQHARFITIPGAVWLPPEGV